MPPEGPPPPETSPEEGPTLAFAPVSNSSPRRVGPFHLKRLIATGGMGRVYEAVQEKPRRTVALKLMKRDVASADALRRFEYESQLLARLRHPGIAQIYHAGTFEEGGFPVPYFAMEYVPNARPLTTYANDRELTLRERLRLFVQVCDAVHHGHQKGIVHRDLKPANILVDSAGQAKIIDFGVARSTDSDLAVTTMQTQVGQLVGTLQYMSPEQCEADPHDIDVRSDVYSLGVILYELLTRQLPYDLSRVAVLEATRVIRQDPPSSISAIDRTLRGDVETIVLKAMEKDRERRYQSALDLSQDIEHFLHGDPIVAHPPSLAYQIRKFASRNRALVTSVAVVFCLLVIALTVSTSLYVRAENARAAATQERERALDAERRAEAINEFLVNDMLAAAAPENSLGREVSVTEVLQEAGRRAAAAFPDDAELRTSLETTIGTVYMNLGRFDEARAQLESAQETLSRTVGDEHPRTLSVRRQLADVLLDQRRIVEADSAYRAVLEIQERILGEEHPETLETVNNLGIAVGNLGRQEEAESLLVRVVEARRRTLGETDRLTHDSMTCLADVFSRQGRYAEAESLYNTVLANIENTQGEKHPAAITTRHNLAVTLTLAGRIAEAEEMYGTVCTLTREVLGEDHVDYHLALYNLASLLERTGRQRKAMEIHARVLELVERSGEELNAITVASAVALGEHWMRTGKVVEALAVFEKSYDTSRRVYGDDHSFTLRALVDVGWAYWELGDPAQAEPYYRETLKRRRQALGEEHAYTIRVMSQAGDLASIQGRHEEGETLAREAARIARRALTENHPQTSHALVRLGRILLRKGDPAAAESTFREALAARSATLPEGHVQIAEVESLLGESLAALERFTEAEPLLSGSYEVISSQWAAAFSGTREARDRLVQLYEAWGRPDEAARYRDENDTESP